MIRILKRNYRDAAGNGHTTKTYYLVFYYPAHVRHKLAAFTDRTVTENLRYHLQRLLDCRASGDPLDADLTLWLERVEDRIRDRLVEWGILDAARVAKPIEEHIQDYEVELTARKRKPDYVRDTVAMIRAAFAKCRVRQLSDLSASRLQAYLGDRQSGEDGISAGRRNGILTACKGFLRWMQKDRRLVENPFAHLKKISVKTDRRLQRRALSPDECRVLLEATRRGPLHHDMSGPDRAMLYHVALETGLRWSELRSLTRASFALGGESPTVTVRAAYSKRGEEDRVPLRSGTVAILQDYLGNKLPSARAFPMPDQDVGAAMLREDLAAAEIPDTDAAGRVVDFHALRHTFVSNLVRAGVNPKVAQELARHSTITLTMEVYTHLTARSQRDGLDALPDLTAPPPSAAQVAQATGTEGARASEQAGAPPSSEDEPPHDGGGSGGAGPRPGPGPHPGPCSGTTEPRTTDRTEAHARGAETNSCTPMPELGSFLCQNYGRDVEERRTDTNELEGSAEGHSPSHTRCGKKGSVRKSGHVNENGQGGNRTPVGIANRFTEGLRAGPTTPQGAQRQEVEENNSRASGSLGRFLCQTTPARAVPDPVRQDLPQLFKQVQDLLTSNSENTRSVQAAVADLAAEIGKLLVAVKKLRVGGRSR